MTALGRYKVMEGVLSPYYGLREPKIKEKKQGIVEILVKYYGEMQWIAVERYRLVEEKNKE
jgi:hypothetical protein